MPKLNETLVKNLPVPEKGAAITWDDQVKGFGVRVTAAGVRSFILNYRTLEKIERRLTIGRYGDWSAEAARGEAKALRRQIDQGADPVVKERETRAAPTVGDLCDRYKKDELPKRRASTIESYGAIIDKVVVPALGRRKLASLQYEDVDTLYRRLAARTPYKANRVHSLLRRMFNLAQGRWYRDHLKDWHNPARGVERVSEDKRKRYLTSEELPRLVKALADYPMLEQVRLPKKGQRQDEHGALVKTALRRRDTPHPIRQQSANIIRLLMLTGARRGEVMGARWEQFVLKAGTWTKPAATTKQNSEHQVPLSAPVRQLLAEMYEARDKTSPYLFPGDTPDTHQKDIKNAWAAICQAAGIENLRIHDLRHSYASLLVSAGFSLPLIGALLGHTKPETTARYAHLLDDPQRKATEHVGALVHPSPTTAEVVPLGRVQA